MQERKRLTILCVVLLIVLSVYFFKVNFANIGAVRAQALPGSNIIKSVRVESEAGKYFATVDYFYSGEPDKAFVAVFADNETTTTNQGWSSEQAQIGTHSLRLLINRPNIHNEANSTSKVIAKLGNYLYSVELVENFSIDWPDRYSYYQDQKTTALLFKEAVQYIDFENPDMLPSAKSNLERIVLRNPNYVDVYPELARIKMRENRSQEGLAQAEQYLKTGLDINKDHANSHVLLGYVYTNQNKLTNANAEFLEAERIGTPNLWLWTNWGDLLLKQNNVDGAINYYIKATSSPRTNESYDRARIEAYYRLFEINRMRRQTAQSDELYTKREQEYAIYPCFYNEHAEFAINYLANSERAVEYAKKAIDKGCDSAPAKKILGIAYYLQWQKSNDKSSVDNLGLARTFFPEGSELYSTLAKNDNTYKVLKALLVNHQIDTKDSKELTALSIALIAEDIDSAKRLIKAGAKLTTLVTSENYPVAFIPVFYQSTKGVELITNSGLDLENLKYKGLTIFDYAKRLPSREIVDILEKRLKTRT